MDFLLVLIFDFQQMDVLKYLKILQVIIDLFLKTTCKWSEIMEEIQFSLGTSISFFLFLISMQISYSTNYTN